MVNAKRQASTEFADDFNFSAGFLQLALSLQTDGLVEGYAKHPVGIFEFFGVVREERAFSVRQDGPPVLLHGIVPASRAVATQKSSPKKRKYNKIHWKWYWFVAAGSFGPLYSPFISRT